MARAPTDVGLCECPHCITEIISLRERMAIAESCLEIEKDFGKRHGDHLGRVETRVGSLEEKRARSEGRDEIRDKTARSWGKGGAALGGLLTIWELIQHLVLGG